jgi:hypothetical protein
MVGDGVDGEAIGLRGLRLALGRAAGADQHSYEDRA